MYVHVGKTSFMLIGTRKKLSLVVSIEIYVDHLISAQSLNLGGRRSTTDDVATIPFHPSLSFAALRESPNPIPVHSLILYFHLFFCLPLLLAPFTAPGTPTAFWILLRTS